MSLFADDYVLDLTPDEWVVFDREVNGNGGAQRLLQKLHAGALGGYKVAADYRMLDKSYQYAYRYANGGFQDRFRAVVKAATRAGWAPPDHEPPRRRAGGAAFGRRR